jgi:hypothetical protein
MRRGVADQIALSFEAIQKSTVGASLLAMAVCQPLMICRNRRHREQARSYTFPL